jgi:hypothetical protein
MMVYELVCSYGHRFEGWFKDHAAFEKQLENELIECPQCSTKVIRQRFSTGGIVRTTEEPVAPAGNTRPAAHEVHSFLKSLKGLIDKHFEDVGSGFAQEALKMHYGVEEKRNIRGVTTEAEEQVLLKEGVDYLKVPLPIDKDDSELQ